MSEAIPLQPRAIPNEGPAGSLQLEDGCAGPEQDIAVSKHHLIRLMMILRILSILAFFEVNSREATGEVSKSFTLSEKLNHDYETLISM